jgi:hypothetical protein
MLFNRCVSYMTLVVLSPLGSIKVDRIAETSSKPSFMRAIRSVFLIYLVEIRRQGKVARVAVFYENPRQSIVKK